MNRVTKRTWIMGLFILVLVGGMVFFLGEYTLKAKQWVVFSGSPHLYSGTNLGFGTVTDRSGELLLDLSEGRSYSQDEKTRRSTLHWLGDRDGYIQASVIAGRTAEMAGFDLMNGVYTGDGTGGTAMLTLSARIQNAALDAMAGRKGTIGIYNYKTGEILCAVSTPNYDPDNVPDISGDGDGRYDGVYVNRFMQSAYIPGSIFKIVTTAAALECVDGIEEMSFQCYGKLEYGTQAVTCEKMHGKQSLSQAFANSCNCAYAQVAELVGKDKMMRYVRQFAVTKSVEIDGVATQKGNYDNSDAAPVSFAWSCIGQYTDLINPARFMTFVGAIANDGMAVEPHLIASTHSGEKLTYQAKPENGARILPQETAQKMQAYMRGNVQNVYGDWNFPGLTVCAKSGTSQLGGGQTANAMFAGFVQDEAYPLAFIVVVENGGYGSSTCVPILSKVLPVCKEVMDGE